MIASIVDAPMDPLVGVISDRTRTRWGRYRPDILFGAAPLGLAFVLLYYRPPLVGVGLLIGCSLRTSSFGQATRWSPFPTRRLPRA